MVHSRHIENKRWQKHCNRQYESNSLLLLIRFFSQYFNKELCSHTTYARVEPRDARLGKQKQIQKLFQLLLLVFQVLYLSLYDSILIAITILEFLEFLTLLFNFHLANKLQMQIQPLFLFFSLILFIHQLTKVLHNKLWLLFRLLIYLVYFAANLGLFHFLKVGRRHKIIEFPIGRYDLSARICGASNVSLHDLEHVFICDDICQFV